MPIILVANLPIRRIALLIVVTISALWLAACNQHQYTGLVFDDPQPAFNIAGTDHTGQPFQLSDYRGELSLVFFGYTFCPDVCPMTLANISQAYNTLSGESADLAADLNVVFVTFDPERDTPERLAEYVPQFNPAFHGVYIPAEELEEAKAAYGVYAEKSTLADGQTAAEYLIDHTSGVYLVDRQGNLRALFKHDTDPQILADDLQALLKLR